MRPINNSLILLLLFFLPFGAAAQIVISEVMYDVSGSDEGREWIEIQNVGAESVDLSTWKLYEGGSNHVLKVFRGSAVLPPTGFAVIVETPAKFISDWPNTSGTIFDSSFSLSNSGENLALKNGTATATTATYLSAWGAEGDGNSLQVVSGVWTPAPPTPNAQNQLPPPPKPTPIPAPVSLSPPVSTPASAPESPRVLPPKAKTITKAVPVPVPDISASSSVAFATSTEIEVPTNTPSMFKWWLLLGGVVIVAILTYWTNARTKPDEFTIIDKTEEDI